MSEDQPLAARWGCALAAPIRRRLHWPIDGLAGHAKPRNGKGDRHCKEQLRGVASIHDRGDVLAQMPAYLEKGTREEYARYRKWHAELPPEARTVGFFLVDQGERLKRIFVHDHTGRPEETSPAAWDVARIVHYAGMAYGAAFLSEAEAWRYIAQAARIALDAYGSWEEYGRGYVYGRWFWQGFWEDSMKSTQTQIDGLLADEAGWKGLPWPIDIAALDALAGASVAVDVSSGDAYSCVGVRAFFDCPFCLAPVFLRRATLDVRCDACGELAEEAVRDAWSFALAPQDDDDDDDEYESESEYRKAKQAKVSARAKPSLYTNLDDEIQRAVKRETPLPHCDDCGAEIATAEARTGSLQCACGAKMPVTAVPDWLAELRPGLRWVVGGPTTLGRRGSFLQFLVTKEEP